MSKTIKVTGTGKASARPDLAELTLTLRSTDIDYEKAAKLAEGKVNSLKNAVSEAGFGKNELKTADFRVDIENEHISENGFFKPVFKGYSVIQRLVLRFDLSSEALNRAINAVSSSKASPEITIRFSVKNPDAFRERLLQSAAENARKAAEALCAASGARLGELISIDYSRNEAPVYSPTGAVYAAGAAERCITPNICADIDPEDVKATENVTFVWEISA